MVIKCTLDDDGCVDLLAFLRVVNQINQEQAWAIAYELAALMQRLWPAGNNCAIIEDLAQIHIHQDGHIHMKSLSLSAKTAKTSTTSATATTTTTPAAAAAAATKTTTTTPATKTSNASNGRGVVVDLTDTSSRRQVNSSETTTTTTTTPRIDKSASARRNEIIQNVIANGNCRMNISSEQTDKISSRRDSLNSSNCMNSTQQELPLTPPITPELLDDDIHRRQPAMSESELVSSLGLALFWALDYGIPEDEERKLSIGLEYLIMQSQSGQLSLNKLLDICIKRLPIATKANADLHYSEMCKSMVSDTLELSLLLDKIYTATMVITKTIEWQ